MFLDQSTISTTAFDVHACFISRGRLTIVEPVPETVKPMLDQVLRRSEIEPRINWVQVSVTLISPNLGAAMCSRWFGGWLKVRTFVNDTLKTYK
jgi:hypothetical protein